MYKFHRIILEGHTYCNRKCDFCIVPYIQGNNYNNVKFMSEEILSKTLEEIYNNIHLFKQPLNFSLFRYNEPLVNVEYLEKHSRMIKNKFPNSNIYIHTNGDLLIKNGYSEYKKALSNIDEVFINDYDNNGFDSILEDILTAFPFGKMQFDNSINGNRNIIRVDNDGKKFNFYINSSDHINLTTRGSFLNNFQNMDDGRWLNNGKIRDYKCNIKGKMFVVEYNGDIMGCCEVSNRVKKHSELIIGNIIDGIDIEKYNLIDEFKMEACRNCHSSSNICGL